MTKQLKNSCCWLPVCPTGSAETRQMGLLWRAPKAATTGCPIDFQQAAQFDGVDGLHRRVGQDNWQPTKMNPNQKGAVMKIKACMSSLCALMLATSIASGELVIKEGDSIAFMGDSITQQGNDQKPNGYTMRCLTIFVFAGLIAGSSFRAKGLELKVGDRIAMLSGPSLEIWNWSPSGYMRLLTDEITKAGVKNIGWICLENQKMAQMLARLDEEIIAKAPVYALIIPGTADYNPWTEKTVSEAFKRNLTEIVRKLKAANIKTVIATSYVVNSNLQHPANANVAAHNDFIRALAKEHSLPLIDLVALVNEEQKSVSFDGSPVAKCLVNQIFTAASLKAFGFGDHEVAECRRAWLDTPRAIQLMPSVSVNTYELLKAAAKSSRKDVGAYMTEVLQKSLQ